MADTEAPAQAADPGAAGTEEPHHEPRFRLTFGRLVAAATAAVALIAAAVGLLFQVDPGLAPCLGGPHASFTGAPVFPHYSYHQFLTDMGQSPNGYANFIGAEVRYSYEVQDLRGQTLVLRATLVRLAKDGTVAAADTNPLDANDLFEEQTVKPTQCSQGGGNTVFAHVPAGAQGRFQIYLELYIGTGYSDRIALGQTPVFDG